MKPIFVTILLLFLNASLAWAQDAAPADSASADTVSIESLAKELAKMRLSEDSLRLEIANMRMAQHINDSLRRERMHHRIDSLRATTRGAAVVVEGDTLFIVYAKQGGLSPKERAEFIAHEITKLGKEFTLKPDSVYIESGDTETDVLYQRDVIVSFNELDGLWANTTRDSLAQTSRETIVRKLHELQEANGLWALIKRIVMLLAIIIALTIVFKLINRASRWAIRKIVELAKTRLKPFYVQQTELLSVKRQCKVLIGCAVTLRIIIDLLIVLLTVPLIFSIFPQTKTLASKIIQYIWNPIYEILKGIVDYIPNLFTIIVICLVVKYVVKLVKYFATEISKDRLKINGFYPDWALPTFYIVRFMLYAFMIAMVYPYLPGSNSGVFQGVSVFVGLIVSLGSSSMIGNIIAGLVITYMRPFKMGDRIEVKGITGDVIEKTPFVTRIRTVKNEIVTVPNSFIMTSQTVNFSQSAREYGLIIHTNVNIGYEQDPKRIIRLLIQAALNTEGVVPDPAPFVLLSTLGDDYPVYQVNAYIRDAKLLPDVYSWLHRSIQELFNEEHIEILSPHYVATRDGNFPAYPS